MTLSAVGSKELSLPGLSSCNDSHLIYLTLDKIIASPDLNPCECTGWGPSDAFSHLNCCYGGVLEQLMGIHTLKGEL